jgi:hypothetical protein
MRPQHSGHSVIVEHERNSFSLDDANDALAGPNKADIELAFPVRVGGVPEEELKSYGTRNWKL